jgi:5'-nucleotidase
VPYPIEKKLVIGIASSALFNLTTEDEIFKTQGLQKYREYQKSNIDKILETGVAFPFIKRLLSLNEVFSEDQPIEVILLSKNDPDTGIRIFNSINHYKLNITRAGFLNGKNPYEYISALNIALFLSASREDVIEAVQQGHPAGYVLHDVIKDDPEDHELRIAFDFDGVLIDDEAEKVYVENDKLEDFQAHETNKANIPHNEGPLAGFLKKLAAYQKIELKRQKVDSTYQRILRIAIVTARNAPSHERFVRTLESWKIVPDETFFLGGIEKKRVLEVMKPHLFIDDQKGHLQLDHTNIPAIHIPFGIRNQTQEESDSVDAGLSKTGNKEEAR